MEQALALLIVAGVGAWVFTLLRRSRARLAPTEHAQGPKRLSKKERMLQELEATNPTPHIPTIVELMEQEAKETGVDEIAGGDDLPTPVKLKVWRRDASVREGCSDARALRFVVRAGIDHADATIDDVALTCGDPDRAPEQRPQGDEST